MYGRFGLLAASANSDSHNMAFDDNWCKRHLIPDPHTTHCNNCIRYSSGRPNAHPKEGGGSRNIRNAHKPNGRHTTYEHNQHRERYLKVATPTRAERIDNRCRPHPELCSRFRDSPRAIANKPVNNRAPALPDLAQPPARWKCESQNCQNHTCLSCYMLDPGNTMHCVSGMRAVLRRYRLTLLPTSRHPGASRWSASRPQASARGGLYVNAVRLLLIL